MTVYQKLATTYLNSRRNILPNLHLEKELQKPNKLLSMNRNQGTYSQVRIFALNSQMVSWTSRNTQNYSQCPLAPLTRDWTDTQEGINLLTWGKFSITQSFKTDSHLLRRIYTIYVLNVSFPIYKNISISLLTIYLSYS